MKVTARAIVVSKFALDGGAMHGVVPRILWQRTHKPDDKHRIALVARALLVDEATSGARTLLDLGLGPAWNDAERDRFGIEGDGDVPATLAAAGIDPATVSHVVLTHLHWDHMGGLVDAGGDLAFPSAEIIVSRRALEHARAPTAKDEGSFRADLIDHLSRQKHVRVLDEEALDGRGAIAPGLVGISSHGHTQGMIVPLVLDREDGPPLAFPTDLVPTRSHTRVPWIPAYDVLPVESTREKAALLDRMADAGGGLVFYHDPKAEVGWVSRSTSAEIEVDPGALHPSPGVA